MTGRPTARRIGRHPASTCKGRDAVVDAPHEEAGADGTGAYARAGMPPPSFRTPGDGDGTAIAGARRAGRPRPFPYRRTPLRPPATPPPPAPSPVRHRKAAAPWAAWPRDARVRPAVVRAGSRRAACRCPLKASYAPAGTGCRTSPGSRWTTRPGTPRGSSAPAVGECSRRPSAPRPDSARAAGPWSRPARLRTTSPHGRRSPGGRRDAPRASGGCCRPSPWR